MRRPSWTSPPSSPAAPGREHPETLAFARHCEALGYGRYWLAEHHNSASQAGTAPEILIAAIAATTAHPGRQRRRHAAALFGPEGGREFRVLEAIAPGRIDMGLGRAPGSDGMTAYALNPHGGQRRRPFPSQVRDLLAWVRGETLVGGPPVPRRRGATARADSAGAMDPRQQRLRRPGRRLFRPAVLLRQLHHRRRGAEQALGVYRDRFRPSKRCASHGDIAVWAMAADTEAEADGNSPAAPLAAGPRPRRLCRTASPDEAAAYVTRRRTRTDRAIRSAPTPAPGTRSSQSSADDEGLGRGQGRRAHDRARPGRAPPSYALLAKPRTEAGTGPAAAPRNNCQRRH